VENLTERDQVRDLDTYGKIIWKGKRLWGWWLESWKAGYGPAVATC